MADPGSNSLNLHELGGKEVNLRKYLTRSIFVSDLSLLNLNIKGAYNLKNRQIYKNPHKYTILLIISYEPTNFGSQGGCNENLRKGLQALISLEI